MSVMKDSKAEIVVFSSEDVMTTSLFINPEVTPGSVPVLWLDSASARNFNLYNDGDNTNQLMVFTGTSSEMYYAYSGVYDGEYLMAGSSTVKPQYLNRMAEGDAAKYQVILDWLVANKQADS